jgi:hypothetical protein
MKREEAVLAKMNEWAFPECDRPVLALDDSTLERRMVTYIPPLLDGTDEAMVSSTEGAAAREELLDALCLDSQRYLAAKLLSGVVGVWATKVRPRYPELDYTSLQTQVGRMTQSTRPFVDRSVLWDRWYRTARPSVEDWYAVRSALHDHMAEWVRQVNAATAEAWELWHAQAAGCRRIQSTVATQAHFRLTRARTVFNSHYRDHCMQAAVLYTYGPAPLVHGVAARQFFQLQFRSDVGPDLTALAHTFLQWIPVLRQLVRQKAVDA